MGGGDDQANDGAGSFDGVVYMNGLHIGAAPDQLSRLAARTVQQHRQYPAYAGTVEGQLLGVQNVLQGLQAFVFDRIGDLGIHGRSRGSRPPAVFE